MNDTLRRHLISAGVTFVTAFCTTVVAMIKLGDVSPDNFGAALVISIVLAAVRAGFKAAAEGWLGLQG